MELVISTVVCIGILIVFNVCAKKGFRLPAKMLVLMTLLGVAVAVVISLAGLFLRFDELILSGLFGLSSNNFFYLLIDNFILTALVEEGLKYLVARLYLRKKNLKCLYQGMVAVIAVATGFVIAENIVYIVADYNLNTLILRLTFGIFGHVAYAIFMGHDIVLAQQATDPSKRRLLYLRALFLPVLYHGIYDLALEILQLEFDEILYILVVLHMIGAFVFFYVIGTIKKLIKAGREMKALAQSQNVVESQTVVESQNVVESQSVVETQNIGEGGGNNV